MGAAVSGWQLAKAVSQAGQLGVVSGTALGSVMLRRLQVGDPGGPIRRAMKAFPIPEIANRVLSKFFVEGGKAPTAPFALAEMPTLQSTQAIDDLTVLANFVEVYLAKEGHNGVVGINFLEKIQIPTIASLFGAMLAGVDYVLMGAGIPKSIPGVLDRLARGEAVEMKVFVEGSLPEDVFLSKFDPAKYFKGSSFTLRRPIFLAIVASATLATTLTRKSNGHVDGFIIEGETAGGHNAPPRGELTLNSEGEPIYGPRDVVDLEKIRALGLPFWLAGSYARPEQLAKAIQAGANGVQIGTAFAFCDESGISPSIKSRVMEMSRQKKTRVFTDPLASPTGFPFKVLLMDGTLSDASQYEARPRICDLGYLRHPYRKPDGTVGYRCPAEPVEDFLRKGGHESETVGRKCFCNGLVSTIGLEQIRHGSEHEPAIITAGNDAINIERFLPPGKSTYSATDVIDYLLSQSGTPPSGPVESL